MIDAHAMTLPSSPSDAPEGSELARLWDDRLKAGAATRRERESLQALEARLAACERTIRDATPQSDFVQVAAATAGAEVLRKFIAAARERLRTAADHESWSIGRIEQAQARAADLRRRLESPEARRDMSSNERARALAELVGLVGQVNLS
jgi:hypothetical protein